MVSTADPSGQLSPRSALSGADFAAAHPTKDEQIRKQKAAAEDRRSGQGVEDAAEAGTGLQGTAAAPEEAEAQPGRGTGAPSYVQHTPGSQHMHPGEY